MNEYKRAIRKMLDEIVPYEEIGDDMDLIKMEILDSLSLVYFITQLEDMYHITIEEKDIVPENFASINNMAVFVQRVVGGKMAG